MITCVKVIYEKMTQHVLIVGAVMASLIHEKSVIQIAKNLAPDVMRAGQAGNVILIVKHVKKLLLVATGR